MAGVLRRRNCRKTSVCNESKTAPRFETIAGYFKFEAIAGLLPTKQTPLNFFFLTIEEKWVSHQIFLFEALRNLRSIYVYGE